MEKKKVITANDYQRLTGLLESPSMKKKMPEIATHFYRELKGAKMLPPDKISGNIITMNSRAILKDVANGREAELTIAYPQDADNRERKVSVFSSIGMALLGKQVGDVVSWKVPAGNGQFEILKVTYQPEAVGDYSL
jgi:regulator of nucleoside diphosphate kinase